MDSRSQDWNRLREYADALEEERRKILAFEKELPLCLQLVTHAIESCKQQIGMDQQYYSDCEAASSEERMVEEFIPMKISSSCTDQEDDHPNIASTEREDEVRGRDGKRDWLNSVQLWNTQDGHPSQHDEFEEPLEISRKKEEKQAMVVSSSHKKARRCWSPDLHKSFLQALQQLGGAHVATPKQIREVMRVKGLTNDEVKSHLQKYRLHTRGPSPTKQSKSPPPSAQFVVLGGLWIPPPEFAGANAGGTINIDSPARQLEVTNNACTNKAYTRVARPQHKQQNSPMPRNTRTATGGICSFRRDIPSSSLATSSTPHITASSLFIH